MVKLVGNDFKLIVIIVKKNLGRGVIKACKSAGAEGGTVLPGRGTSVKSRSSFLGIAFEPEKDVILCLVPNNLINGVIAKVRKAAKLDKPGTGVAFVINSKNICGIAHLLCSDNIFNKTQQPTMPNPDDIQFQLIVTIVNRGLCGVVVDSSREAGAEGGTIITGRGSGIHEKAKLFSFSIEPEKEIVLTLVPADRTEKVLDTIVKATELNEPGNGIAFVLDVDDVTGIHHLNL